MHTATGAGDRRAADAMLIFTVIAWILVPAAVLAYACCAVSGRISREEEDGQGAEREG